MKRSLILTGDCREVMAQMAAESVDSIVTDPPYGLSFMGKKWDYDVPGVEVWIEALRVLKPGGHLLSFAGTRTHHRMAVNIEDAGFEIRDMIAWVYGSGFPKSMNVGKAIDGSARGEPQGGSKPSSANHGKYKGGCTEESPNGRGFGAGPGKFMAEEGEHVAPVGLVDEAQPWAGWGTALKPAMEPIVVARKPLIGTVAQNVLQHGTGAINIDGCRVDGDVGEMRGRSGTSEIPGGNTTSYRAHNAAGGVWEPNQLGRWPANLVHDGSDEVLAAFPESAGQQGDLVGHSKDRKSKTCYGDMKAARDAIARRDTGSAARFFYCAKASKADRGEGNTHPTVKPTDLMRYLVRLVTPPGGVVLDPFAGSGSTLKAALLEGLDCIGIERDLTYLPIIHSRIDPLTEAPMPLYPDLLPPAHVRVVEHQGRIILADNDDNVYFEVSPDGYDKDNNATWSSPESKTLAYRRALALKCVLDAAARPEVGAGPPLKAG